MSLFKKNKPPQQDSQEETLIALYNKYAAHCKNIALSYLHNDQEADDIVQEVFLHLVKKISELDLGDCNKVNHYIVIVTKGRCLNRIKKRSQIISMEESLFDAEGAPLELEDSQASTEAQVLRRMDVETTGKLLSEIGEPYQSIILLKYGQDKSDADIAEALSLPPQNIRIYARRAREKLRRLAIERGSIYEK